MTELHWCKKHICTMYFEHNDEKLLLRLTTHERTWDVCVNVYDYAYMYNWSSHTVRTQLLQTTKYCTSMIRYRANYFSITPIFFVMLDHWCNLVLVRFWELTWFLREAACICWVARKVCFSGFRCETWRNGEMQGVEKSS